LRRRVVEIRGEKGVLKMSDFERRMDERKKEFKKGIDADDARRKRDEVCFGSSTRLLCSCGNFCLFCSEF